jgi:hypothetical protein
MASFADAWWQRDFDITQAWTQPDARAVVDWLVVGGGPCGTCAVGALLDRGAGDSVGWVSASPWADVGRLGRYGGVPANTRNDRLVAAFTSLGAFDFGDAQRARAAPTLVAADPAKTAPLALAADALRDASAAMRAGAGAGGPLAFAAAGRRVRRLARVDGHWAAYADGVLVARARRVVLATGGAPRPPPAALAAGLAAHRIPVVDHDAAIVKKNAPRRPFFFSRRTRRPRFW